MYDETELKSNESINQYCGMVICWKRIFCGMNYFIISICDVEYQFNDDTNERYHLLFHHKESEQSKNI